MAPNQNKICAIEVSHDVRDYENMSGESPIGHLWCVYWYRKNSQM